MTLLPADDSAAGLEEGDGALFAGRLEGIYIDLRKKGVQSAFQNEGGRWKEKQR